MTITQFITKKNKILQKKTGILLVPEHLIVETVQVPLGLDNDSDCCPYCHIWGNDQGADDGCEGCPMYENGDDCNDSESTYNQIRRKLGGQIHDIPKIKKLVKQFNEELPYYGREKTWNY